MLHRAAERTLLREGAAAATEERERSGLGKTRGWTGEDEGRGRPGSGTHGGGRVTAQAQRWRDQNEQLNVTNGKPEG